MQHILLLGNLVYLNLFNENMLQNIINQHDSQLIGASFATGHTSSLYKKTTISPLKKEIRHKNLIHKHVHKTIVC